MIDHEGPTVASTGHLQAVPFLDEIELARLVTQHEALRRMCDELEACADCLPDRRVVERAALVSAALAIRLLDHDSGDHALLHTLVAGDRATEMASLVSRIRHSHAIDQLQAEDLRDALQTAAADPAPIPAEMLSYMMRCLFDGCRRGIDFQEAALLMLADDRLTPAVRAQIGSSLRNG